MENKANLSPSSSQIKIVWAKSWVYFVIDMVSVYTSSTFRFIWLFHCVLVKCNLLSFPCKFALLSQERSSFQGDGEIKGISSNHKERGSKG